MTAYIDQDHFYPAATRALSAIETFSAFILFATEDFVALQTHTIVQILLRALHQQDLKQRPAGPYLVAAQTNTAVDNIMRKLRTTISSSNTGDFTHISSQKV